MADSTARALQLLELLQSAHVRTVAELAERLGVDERTVRRHVRRLVELDVPVESVRGRYGGYRLAPGRRVLPLMFSAEEVVAVFLGLAYAQAATSGEPGVVAQTALAKIRRALPAGDTARVDAALAAMVGRAPRHDVDVDPAVMLTLAEAVSSRHLVDLRYRDREGAPSRRTVHPYGLVAHRQRWYLVAFDTASWEERTFRVDRVRTARSLPGTFTPPVRPVTATGLAERFSEAHYPWHVVLRIRATHDRIRERLPASVARLERLDGGAGGATDPAAGDGADGAPPWHRAEIRADALDWIPPLIAALACEVVIEAPDELRHVVRAAAARMHAAADGAVSPPTAGPASR